MTLIPNFCKELFLRKITSPVVKLCLFYTLIFVNANAQTSTKPNVILILADDVGYEIPTVNGGQSYSTPNIDSMARHGMNFTHCEASPLCAPSRLMLLTGKYSFRNYSMWGYMNNGEKTLGNLMKSAGYKTGWFGKLQLYSRDSDMINMGFDDYFVLEALNYAQGSRYKNPVLYSKGFVRVPSSATENQYADDMITQQLFKFIDSNKSQPFFAYYPMSLVHGPRSPTPDDAAFASWDPKQADDSFFPSMVKYMDKVVGQILQKLRDEGLAQNTIVIFVGDNGTETGVTSIFDGEEITGGKTSTLEAGTHVPLMVYWPGHIAKNVVNNDLVDFTDFFPTLGDAAGLTDLSVHDSIDGRSFFPRLIGQAGNPRDWIFDHYDAQPSFFGPSSQSAIRWIQNKTYKLYDVLGGASAGKFYNIDNDVKELNPLSDSILTPGEKAVKQYFRSILDTMPRPPDEPVIINNYATKITSTSAILGATIVTNGGSNLRERGSVLTVVPREVTYQFNRLLDSIAVLGTFEQTRTGLTPQTAYNYSLYAMNNNRSDNTGFATRSVFTTLSAPPLSQPSTFTATAGRCFVSLKWGRASFPRFSKATKAGYLLAFGTSMPSLVDSPNQKAPGQVIASGRLFPLPDTTSPAAPGTSVKVLNLSKDSAYYFLLVPYTWNGTDTATYNYLTAGALTVQATALAGITLAGIVTQPVCASANTGAIKVTASKGYAPYLFSLSGNQFDTSSLFRNLAAGNYTVTAKDSVGCVASLSANIIQPTPITISSVVSNTTYYGAANGSVSISATGGKPPYKYSFNGSAFSTVTSYPGLAAGTYIINVQDAKLCIVSGSVTVMQPAVLSFVANTSNVSCYGANNGYVSVAASGGTAPYRYSFNYSVYDTVSILNSLSPGNVNIRVKDATGHIVSGSVTIQQPKKLALAITHTNVSCNGQANGFIQANASGGTLPYMYSNNGGNFDTSAAFAWLVPGSYNITVKDNNGCMAAASTSVTQPPALAVTRTITNVTCNGGNNGLIKVTGTGTTTPYQYSLNNGAYDTTSTFTPVTAGNYTITAKDVNGCTRSYAAVVTQPAAITINPTVVNVSYYGLKNGSIKLSAGNGLKPYNYSLNNGAYNTTGYFGSLGAGDYNVSVQDAKGCTSTALVTITQPTSLSLANGVNNTLCNGANNGPLKIIVSPNPAQGRFRLAVSDGKPNEQVHIKVIDMYGRTVHFANGMANNVYYFGSNFIAGVYIVQVYQGTVIKTVKVVKGK